MDLCIKQIESINKISLDLTCTKYDDLIIEIFNSEQIHIEKYDLSDGQIVNIIGLYYKHNKNYDLAVKYYLMGAELGNVKSINNLAFYYEKIKKDYELAVKYYLMAVELGYSDAMNNLGYYYENNKKYDLAVKYYLMGAELGNSDAMHNLAYYYNIVEMNYEKAVKYYLMAVELGNSDAMHNLAYYYNTMEMNYEQAIKYYLMAIEQNNPYTINNLIKLSKTRPINVYNSLINCNFLKSNIDLENLKNSLAKSKQVVIFKNKVRIFDELNNIRLCPICLDTKLNINLDCGHLVCICCYPSIDSCYLKCCD
jgi:tetratricopeptide (TPR) repeat protein